MCGLFYPQQVRESVSLIITKWVQCDNSACKHWVHLLFCTEINTAVRRGTKYFSEHCENEFSEEYHENIKLENISCDALGLLGNVCLKFIIFCIEI